LTFSQLTYSKKYELPPREQIKKATPVVNFT